MTSLLLDLPYIFEDFDERGNKRIYVRRHGHKIRLRDSPGTPEFLRSYSEALAALNAAAGAAEPIGGKTVPGTFGWLSARYMASTEFKALDTKSQSARRSTIESCLDEPLRPGATDLMDGCPIKLLTSEHIKMLRQRKADFPGAANNRLKHLSAMLGWAVEASLIKSNPARDVRRMKYATTGFHQWTVDEVRQYEVKHAIGTKARLALALLLYLGVRRGDVVTLGRQHVKNGWIRFIPNKTRYRRLTVSEKPVLPDLARVIAASPCGELTFLVTSYGRAFTANGFGGWFRERCDEAGLPHCSAHGLRKAGATIAAEAGATDRQLMAMYDWTSASQASIYTQAADKRRLTGEASRLVEGHMANTELTQPIDPAKKTSKSQ